MAPDLNQTPNQTNTAGRSIERPGRLATGLLAVIAGLLAVDVLAPRTGEGVSPLTAALPEAHAASPATPGGGALTSAAEQRKLMIAELRQMRSKVESLEKRIASGLSVKVTDMPQQKQSRDEE